MDDRRTPVSRRAALAGLGVSAGALVLGERAAAGATPSTVALPFAPVRSSANSGPPGFELLGRADVRLAAADFRTLSAADSTLSPGALNVTGTTTAVASFKPRAGDRIWSVTFYLNPNGAARAVRLSAEGPTGIVSNLASGTSPAGTAATEVRLDLPSSIVTETIGGNAYTVSIDVGPGVVVYGAMVSMISATSEFVLLDPFRVWDSRTPGGTLLFPGGNGGGRISAGQTRYFTVDGFVARSVAGLLLNVTLADTVGAGFLTFYGENPDDPTPPPVSSINWHAADQIVANLVVTEMTGEADVAIRCGGGGSTHYVIDCLGYFS